MSCELDRGRAFPAHQYEGRAVALMRFKSVLRIGNCLLLLIIRSLVTFAIIDAPLMEAQRASPLIILFEAPES